MWTKPQEQLFSRKAFIPSASVNLSTGRAGSRKRCTLNTTWHTMPSSTTPPPPNLPHQKGPVGSSNFLSFSPPYQNLTFPTGCKYHPCLPGFPTDTSAYVFLSSTSTSTPAYLCDHLVTHNRKSWLTRTLRFYAGRPLTPVSIVCCPMKQLFRQLSTTGQGKWEGKAAEVREVVFSTY